MQSSVHKKSNRQRDASRQASRSTDRPTGSWEKIKKKQMEEGQAGEATKMAAIPCRGLPPPPIADTFRLRAQIYL